MFDDPSRKCVSFKFKFEYKKNIFDILKKSIIEDSYVDVQHKMNEINSSHIKPSHKQCYSISISLIILQMKVIKLLFRLHFHLICNLKLRVEMKIFISKFRLNLHEL